MKMQAETALPDWRKNVFAFSVLFLLVVITYSNTIDASWHFDDINNIVDNRPLHLTEFSFENIKKTFFASWDGKGKLYRPVACLSLAINYYFGGAEVAGYHAVNLIIHYFSACFLFLFMANTLRLPLLTPEFQSKAYFIALLSTAFWAVNPVQTQAVTYVVQRMTAMSGVFCIMAMYFFVKGKGSLGKSTRIIHYTVCFSCGLLALGSKENAIMLPLTLLIYDLLLVRGATRRNLGRYALYGILALTACTLLVLLLQGPSFLNPERLVASYQNRGFTLWERLLTESRVILFYVSLLLYPMHGRLCLEHDITLSTGLLSPVSTLVSILAICGIVALAIYWARKRPLISFSILFFFMNHLVESSILPLELIFEHRNYFPSMLFFVPAAILLHEALTYFAHKPFFRFSLSAFVILILVGWGHSTYVRNAVWKTDETLWSDCIIKYPHLSRPHHNLGVYYERMEKFPEAVSEYRKALTKENRNNLVWRNWTYYNLGAIYQKLHQDEKALFYYDQAQKYQPHFAPTHLAKGVIFMRNRRYEEAGAAFQKAIQSDPKNASAYGNLGFLSLVVGEPEKAMATLVLASSLEPKNSQILRHMGIAHKLQGDTEKALMSFRKALTHDETDPFVLLNLAALYKEKGMDEAKNDTMARFHRVFEGKNADLGRFMERLKPEPGIDDALSSHRMDLLLLLSNAQRN